MATKEQICLVKSKSKNLRGHILTMIGVGKAGHLGGSNSSADIVSALYFYKMKVNPNEPKDENRDYFILSKGHGALVQYAALAELDYFDKKELKSVKALGSMLQGHPDINKTPGIEANTGSLGQGLSIACGIAMGLKIDKKMNKVYVVVGDGEQNEGQIWEAASAAANFKLDNLVVILDKNKLQATGPTVQRFDMGAIAEKWHSFGFKVIEIDGHNHEQICDALDAADNVNSQPTIIIANTIKGKGITFAENNPAFHNSILNEEQLEKAKQDLEFDRGSI